MLYSSSSIAVGLSEVHGRGVFAVKDIKLGELIEECHAILLKEVNFKALDEELQRYVYSVKKQSALVMGRAMVYNHSYENASVHWLIDYENLIFRFYSSREIKKGEEIFINYRQKDHLK